MNIKNLILSTLGVAFLLMAQASAQSLTLSSIRYSPMVMDDKQGIVIDIVTEALKRSGHETSFVIYPWARALTMANKGRVHGITPVFKTEEREKKLLFHQTPVMTIDMVLFKLRRDKTEFNGKVESISGKRVAFITKTNLTPEFDEAKNDGRIMPVFVDSIEQQMKLLNVNRVDYAVAERFAGLRTIAKLGLGYTIKPSTVPVASNPVFIGLHKSAQAPKLASEIDKALQEMHKDGSYRSIIDVYSSVASR